MRTVEQSLLYFDWLCSLSAELKDMREDLKREAENERQYSKTEGTRSEG